MTLLLAVALLAASDPAVAAPQSAAAAPAAQAKQKEKKICRTEEAFTGSRMTRKTCLTVSEWERRDGGGVDAADLKTMGAH